MRHQGWSNRNRLQHRHDDLSDSHWIITPTTFLAGPNGCGKSLILKVLNMLAEEDPAFPAFDMSDVIRWHRDNEGSNFCAVFRAMKDLQKEGKLLPDKPILHGAVKYIKHLGGQVVGGHKHVFLSGGLRNKNQAQFIIRRYAEPKLVEISCTPEESLSGVLTRDNGGRDDSSDLDVIKRRFEISMTATKDGIEYFAEQNRQRHHTTCTLRLKRSDSLLSKIQLIIAFINIPDFEKNLWFKRCSDPTHLAGAFIRALDKHGDSTKSVTSSRSSQMNSISVPASTIHTPVLSNVTRSAMPAGINI